MLKLRRFLGRVSQPSRKTGKVFLALLNYIPPFSDNHPIRSVVSEFTEGYRAGNCVRKAPDLSQCLSTLTVQASILGFIDMLCKLWVCFLISLSLLFFLTIFQPTEQSFLYCSLSLLDNSTLNTQTKTRSGFNLQTILHWHTCPDSIFLTLAFSIRFCLKPGH